MNARLKHYAKWQFKKWWPILAIFSGILFMIFWISTSTSVLAFQNHSGQPMEGGYAPSHMLSIAIPAMIMAYAMPIPVFFYRTSRQSIDTFLQAAHEENQIKRVRIFLGGAILIASFTAAYFLGLAAYAFRVFSTYAMYGNNPDWVVMKVTFSPYFIGYFMILFALMAQYGINCFLASLGNYVFDDILLMIFGNVILALFLVSPTLYVMAIHGFTFHGVNGDATSVYMSLCFYNFGPANGPICVELLLGPLCQHVDLIEHAGLPWIINCIISYVLNLIVGALLLSYTCFHGEPSGEVLARAGARNNNVAMIPHGAALALGILFSILGHISSIATNTYMALTGITMISIISEFIFFVAIYFLILAAWRHSFRMKKRDLIYFGSVVGFVFVLTLITVIAGLSVAATY